MSEPTFGPYSPVRQAGNLYFVSGQVGVTAAKTASQDVAVQTKQALNNMQALLEIRGLGMADVMKTTIFLANMDDFDKVNTVYEEFFDAPRPARSTVGVTALPKIAGDTKLLVEIEAVAYNGSLS
jgi:2-iminobutanoate/2-iminopropanoate deaminase